MSKRIETKPCPWCGEKPVEIGARLAYVHNGNRNYYLAHIRCETLGCPARPEVFAGSLPEAQRKWNMRKG